MIKLFKIADKRKIRKMGTVPVGILLRFCGYGLAVKQKSRKRRERDPPTVMMKRKTTNHKKIRRLRK